MWDKNDHIEIFYYKHGQRQLFKDVEMTFKENNKNQNGLWKWQAEYIHVSRAYIRSSRPEVFCKKVLLRNFVKFTGKHLCQSLFFNKVAGPSLLKKRLWHRCFPENM